MSFDLPNADEGPWVLTVKEAIQLRTQLNELIAQAKETDLKVTVHSHKDHMRRTEEFVCDLCGATIFGVSTEMMIDSSDGAREFLRIRLEDEIAVHQDVCKEVEKSFHKISIQPRGPMHLPVMTARKIRFKKKYAESKCKRLQIRPQKKIRNQGFVEKDWREDLL